MTNRPLKPIAAGILAALALAWLDGPALAAEDARLAEAVKNIQTWNYGDGTDAQNYVAAEVVAAGRDPALRKKIEQCLIAGLAGAKTRGGKDFFCRQLVFVGTGAAVDELAKLLGDAETSHIARYALARIPGERAGAALRDALGKVDDALKVGIVYSLGERCDRAAGEKIAALLNSKNDDLVVASLVALSRMDIPPAEAAIAEARAKLPARLKPAADDAYLVCAALHVKAGRFENAKDIYKKLYAPGEPTMCRVAALKGLIAADPKGGAALAIAAMNDKDEKVRQVAVPALRDIPGTETTRAIAAELPKRDEPVQLMLLSVLTDRGDKAALPAVTHMAASESKALRIAALDALGTLGDASIVGLLIEKAVGTGEEQRVARASLARLRGDRVNAKIVDLIRFGSIKVRAELIRTLAVRQASETADAVIKAVSDSDVAVRTEALKALRTLAGPEQVPTLVKFLTTITDAAIRAEAENAVVAAAKKIAAPESPVAAVLAVYRDAAEPAPRASLLRVMGRIGHSDALPSLRKAATDSNAEVKDAAIRALADWPDAGPIKLLAEIAADKSADEAHRVIALRGFIGMIHKQVDVPDEKILADYARAMTLASRTQEKQLVLSRLAGLRHRGALEMARRYAEEKDLKAAAEAAARQIEKLLAAPAKVTASLNPEKAGNAVDGDASTRWDTGAAMQGGEWFKIDLGEEQLISGIVLDTKGSGGDYPRSWEVYVSRSSLGQGKLVAKGAGNGPVTEIKFDKPVVGKTIKIVQTGKTDGLFWSIHELTINTQPVPE